MSQEKQIEEMAEIMRHSCEKECKRNKHGEFDCEYCEAELLYNAGYRKQSEGEWLYTDICAEDMYCSVCGGIAPVDCEKEAFYKSPYCQNCGAKMKGV